MSDQFDKLKGISEKEYPEYKSWVEENSANFPPHKIGNGAFTMQEASDLLLEFFETIKIVLENKEQCLKHVNSDELSLIHVKFVDILNVIRSDASIDVYDRVANRVEKFIPYMRPFHFLFMEKMDEKRYREINNMDKTLREIKTLQEVITSTANKAKSDSENMRELIESTNKKDEEVNNLMDENIQKVNNVTDMHAQTSDYLNQIKDVLNSANEQKLKIDGFVNLIQERDKDIASQKAATEAYEEKLKDFSDKYNLNMEAAKKLIDEANEALNLSTARGLGKAFLTRQKKLADRNVKKTWLWGGGVAVACAVGIGIVIILLGKDDDAISNIVARTLIMMIFIAVAVFCSKQYAKNRTLEEDYAYKVALVASYPGLAKEFKDAEEMRKEYVVKLLGEILQDPQRARHDKESLIDSHPLMAELKKFMKKNETKIDESKPN